MSNRDSEDDTDGSVTTPRVCLEKLQSLCLGSTFEVNNRVQLVQEFH